ncbi:MAG: hypothetical protein JXA54_11325 [Candidatus Heimdallarchaeota archaeon]|nr:hypothetical protein [Candidatus Heimdallarchaeota archaeon]
MKKQTYFSFASLQPSDLLFGGIVFLIVNLLYGVTLAPLTEEMKDNIINKLGKRKRK